MRHLLSLAVLFCVVAPAASAQRRNEVWNELLPPGNGHGAVVASCTGCHSMKVIVHARRSAQEWAVTVNDMIQRGAPAFPDEIGPMAAFLAKSFTATTPRLMNVNTARREDLATLPGMNTENAARITEARLNSVAFRNSEDLRRALGMEKEEFEKIRYFFKYSD